MRLSLPSVLGTAPARIALGLMSLLVCVLLLLDAGMSALNSRERDARLNRHHTSQNIGLQLTAFVRQLDERGLRRVVQHIAAQQPDVRSVAIRRADGAIVASTEHHARHWTGQATDPTIEVTLPIWKGNERWGQAEIAYGPMRWEGPLGGYLDTPVIFVLGFLLFGGIGTYFFVRRALVHLDPSTAVPARVRSAYDTLNEGVVILDADDRIVLANASFRRLHEEAGEINGKKLEDLTWLQPALPAFDPPRTWAEVGEQGLMSEGRSIDLQLAEGGPRKIVLRAAPIRDNGERLRGTLISLSDQTEVEQANTMLQALNAELVHSREQVAQQNAQLLHLAHHDGLTGCLNRRAFFAQAEKLFAEAREAGRPLAVLMTDVDHFKSFNDRFGHAVGDQVLRGVATALRDELPEDALLCRYGGEEFCVLVPRDRREATAFAERLRRRVEAHAGRDLGHHVTASFGLATLSPGVPSFAAMLERADQALYRAKRDGRNRVAVSVGTGAVSSGSPGGPHAQAGDRSDRVGARATISPPFLDEEDA